MRVFLNLLLVPLMALVGFLRSPRDIVKPPTKNPSEQQRPTHPPIFFLFGERATIILPPQGMLM